MSWIILTKEQAKLYEKMKLTWYWGIDPVKIKNGDFILPERVINCMKIFSIEQREIILSDLSKSTIDEELEKLPTEEKPVF